ncbi:hypothetical protein JYK14_16700 [Siccirubricoccus sp. KC 17139]|uniref:Uncharacterized protein n=1 Tax=Siccirubricoccus soli TaxID=2899147 RepID=A0ABT1D775_9PROT|nr:hypothetical protein [Siccirubricoccus soli]MCO6417789.1 hypothetical protein [Siccirubricoccus soli]MCP2683924.1 hypothetical protein [Siccirubricoccus soli]
MRMLVMAALLWAALAGPALADSPPRVEVVGAAQGPFRVLVNGTLLHSEASARGIDLIGQYAEGPARFALLRINTGSYACAAEFRIIDLGGARPRLSPAFGTCSAEPRVELRDGALLVTLPRYRAGPVATTWRYAEGRLDSRTGPIGGQAALAPGW